MIEWTKHFYFIKYHLVTYDNFLCWIYRWPRPKKRFLLCWAKSWAGWDWEKRLAGSLWRAGGAECSSCSAWRRWQTWEQHEERCSSATDMFEVWSQSLRWWRECSSLPVKFYKSSLFRYTEHKNKQLHRKITNLTTFEYLS